MILSKLYGFDYHEYLESLDLRTQIDSVENVHYLYSKKDPMFSPSHLNLTREALGKTTNVQHEGTEFGFHGEFTKETRNDYMIEFILNAVKSSLSVD